MKFTIESVSKMTGIPAPSLRNWEKRYGFPLPERTPGGHRYYSDWDVEFLRKAVQWIEEGQSLIEVARVYHEEQVQSDSKASGPSVVDDVDYRTQLIYEALLNFDQMATLQHYATLNAKLSVEQLFDRVFEVTLKKIKMDSENGQISAAQERFASAFIRYKLSTFLSLDFPPTQSPKIVLLTLPGETHKSGLMLKAAHLKFRGFPVYDFGSELPFEDLRSLVKEIQPDLVCLSYENASLLMRDLKQLGQLRVPICFTGSALSVTDLKSLKDLHAGQFYFCQKATSSEEAQFIEMICQSKNAQMS